MPKDQEQDHDAAAVRMRQRQGIGPPRENKFGTPIKSIRSMPYVDPAEHGSLLEYLDDWNAMMHQYMKTGGRNNVPRQMVLVVSSVKIGEDEVQILVSHNDKTQEGRSELGMTYNYPGGKLYPHETYIEAAKREYNEETGLLLMHPRLVGILGPTRLEAEELTQPWIVFIVQGSPALAYQHQLAIKPKGERASPCLAKLEHLGSLRALDNIQTIGALVNSNAGDFVIESETMAGTRTTRLITYRPEGLARPLPMKYAHLELEQ